ncbi:MAG: O-antigen ligase family protein [Lachnospiraceae bacterium]|nr:O-antigen ligase family protein [Lachnospiraceae bacterium]
MNIRQRAQEVYRFLVYVFIAVIICIYPFYAPEGYYHITTHKLEFLQNIILFAGVLIGATLLLMLFGALLEVFREKKSYKEVFSFRLSRTDIFALCFAAAVTLSYLFSPYKEEALHGTSGWYMGLLMQLFFVATYLVVSRGYRGEKVFLWLFPIVSGIQALWEVLNRFSVYPIDMKYRDTIIGEGKRAVKFVASLGNINWYCGFLAAFIGIGIGFYYLADKKWQRYVSGIYLFITWMAAVTQSSESIYLSMAGMFLFLIFTSFLNMKRCARVVEMLMMFFGACIVLRLLRIFFPYPDHFNLVGEGLLDFLTTGSFSLFCYLLCMALWAAVIYYFPEKVRKADRKKLKKLRRSIYVGLLLLFCAYLLITLIHTIAPFLLPFLDGKGWFTFNEDYATARGATWGAGFRLFASLPFLRKFVGVGPDCFKVYSYSVDALREPLMARFGDSTLTNAHGEWVNMLANCGIFGAVSYAGIFISAFRRFYKSAEKDNTMILFALCVISYVCNNIVSFQQLVGTPFIFVILGMGEGYYRHVICKIEEDTAPVSEKTGK